MVSTNKATLSRWDAVRHDNLQGTIGRRFIHSDQAMISQITIEPGCRVPPHRHENEQWTYVLKGSMTFTFGDAQDEMMVVRENEIVHIPGNLLHSATTAEGVFELDFFTPPRADWIDGSDQYLRTGGYHDYEKPPGKQA